MKSSKITKSFLALSSAAVLTLPALTLTGCSNISQYCIPVVTDGNPFSIGGSEESITDPYRLTNWGYYNTPEPEEESKVAESYTISPQYLQLPAGYIYTSEYTSAFEPKMNGMYGYCNFNKPEWKHEGPTTEPTGQLDNKYMFNRKNDYDWAWRGVTSSDLTYTTSGALSSYQNLNITNSITAVNSVTNWLLTDFNYMNRYLNNVVGQKKEDDIKKDLTYLFSGQTTDTSKFSYGEYEDSKSNFYQYVLDNANLLSTASSKYKVGPYDVGLTLKDISGFGSEDNVMKGFGQSTNPFLKLEMKDLSKYEYGFSDKSGTNTPNDYSQPFVFPTNNDFTGTYLWDGKDTKNPVYTYSVPKSGESFLNPYIKYTYKENSETKKKEISDFSYIATIPMLISPSHILSAYYDPSTNLTNTIQPADWLTKNSSIDDINKQLKNENSWEDFKKNVDLPDLNVTTLSFDQNSSYGNNDLEYTTKPTTNPYSSWMSEDVQKAYNEKKMDPRIYDWITNGDINFGYWIALANYSTFVVNFQSKYKEGTDPEIKTQCVKALLPYFSGFSTIFPAYMLFPNADCYKQTNTDAEDGAAEKNFYHIEYVGSGIEKDVKNSISALTDNKLPDTTKTYKNTADLFKNDPYMPFIWSFGKLDDTNTAIVDSSHKIIDPAKYYDYLNNIGIVQYSDILVDADPQQ